MSPLMPSLEQPLLGIDDQVLEDPLAGSVMVDQLDQVVALGGRVLRVRPHVEIDPRSVAQEDVAAPAPGHDPPEQVARHLVRGQPPGAARRAGDPVLGLQPVDPPVHSTLPARLRRDLGPALGSAAGQIQQRPELLAGQLSELADLEVPSRTGPMPIRDSRRTRVADRLHRTADDPIPTLSAT